ncbi:Yip1 domain-containing protein, partial [Mycotypha africana]|uniref:Yip1 domain-containing protein n=1 Tax=Mycotypha africana TaxID=64632 RepID=UPI002300F491
SGQDTLDEPVTVTIMRDLKKVGNKLLQVLHPKGDRHVLRDWDLWGPLILCLTLAIVLSIRAPEHQAVPIFTGVFVIVWIGAAVVTLNAKMLGGAVSFFQSVCVMGYCLFPIVVAAIVATCIDYIWVRVPVSIVTFVWSTWASVAFMSESQIHLQNRRALAVYPLVLFYFVITWLVVI